MHRSNLSGRANFDCSKLFTFIQHTEFRLSQLLAIIMYHRFFFMRLSIVSVFSSVYFFSRSKHLRLQLHSHQNAHIHTPTRQTKTEIVDEPRVHQLQFNFSTTSIAWPLGGNDVIHNGKHFWIYYYMLASRSKSIFAIIKLHKFQLVSFVFPFHFFVAVPCNFRAYDIFITQSLTLLNSTELTKKKEKTNR